MTLGQGKLVAPRWGFPHILTLPRAIHLDWSYAVAGTRDLRLDLLRGFAVFVMVVNHFGGASWLYLITGNNSFFVSGAEAFVFISGFVVGMVYGGIALKQGLKTAQIKALERAFTLYKLTIALTLVFAVLSRIFVLPWAEDLQVTDPLTWFIDVVTLHQTFYLADVMLMYTFLMVTSAGALWLLLKNRTGALLALSVSVWLAFQISPMDVQLPWRIAGNGTFNLAAWQLLFFVAMTAGYHRDMLAKKLSELPRAPYGVLSGLMLVWLVLLYSTNGAFLARLFPGLDVDGLIRVLFAKSALAPGRVLACFIVFQFAYLAATLMWKPIWVGLGWLLMPLGQNALYCYTMHMFVIGVAHIAFQYMPAVPTIGSLNTSLQLLTILLIWVMIQRKFLFNIVPR